MKLWPLHRKELIKKLKKIWFKWPYVWWKHDYLKKWNFKLVIPNTNSWKDIAVPIIKAILKQIWIEAKDFLEAN